MTATPEVHIHETEIEQVERWRAEALERAGYDARRARTPSRRATTSICTARSSSLERGCPPELALQILL